jgi:hypothetical protein
MEREKVIVRSNGVVTYVGKDIAYQFWKLGSSAATSTTARSWIGPAAAVGHQQRGRRRVASAVRRRSYVYNVIDVRQSYLQKLLKQALIAVGNPEGAERSHHFSYEMVALSHETARELGHAPAPDSEDARKPFVEVSGRKGLGVKADDLIDTLIQKATEEVAKRNPEFTAADTAACARMLAVAAVRYFMVKFSRGKVIAFDLGEALNFTGESGPYIQYAVVARQQDPAQPGRTPGRLEAALVQSLGSVPPGSSTAATDPRGVGAGARSGAARRHRRTGDPHAGVLGARQVGVLAGPELQRLLSHRPDPEGRTRRRAALARGRGHLRAHAADASARLDGHRGAGADVGPGYMPIVAITPCKKPRDYEAAVRRAGAARDRWRSTKPPPTRSTVWTGCC